MGGGIVFNIMKYSVHDGPGIRTAVFLKGCPLSCGWCHNPESQMPAPQLMLFPERCIGCGACAAVCPNGIYPAAGEVKKSFIAVGGNKCAACGRCVDECHAGAREMAGRVMDAADVIKEVERDVIFYDQSGGGVTFSGGEPLMQPDFLRELLADCREREIHTAVDTSGFAPREKLLDISQLVNLFLYDLKIMDENLHREHTGVSNGLILDNLKELASQHNNIIVRMPVMPGINDHDANINDTGRFIASLPGVQTVQILPYHRAGAEKYRRLGLTYGLPELRPPEQEKMNAIAEKLGGFGLTVRVGH